MFNKVKPFDANQNAFEVTFPLAGYETVTREVTSMSVINCLSRNSKIVFRLLLRPKNFLSEKLTESVQIETFKERARFDLHYVTKNT